MPAEVKINSLRKLANALGRGLTTVYKYTQRPDWPFPRKGDWTPHVPAIKRWIAENLSPNPASETADADPISDLHLSPEREAKIKLLITRQAKLELERAIMAGEYVKKADKDRQDIQKVAAVRAGLQQLQRRISPHVDAATEAMIEEEIRSMCDAFAGEG